MAERLLSRLLKFEVDHELVITSIKSASSIECEGTLVSLAEFIPHFLSYLHEKLNLVSTNTTNGYFSPRLLEKRKQKNESDDSLVNGDVDNKKHVPIKTPRLSLQYSSSSPMKNFKAASNNDKQQSDVDYISGISPIKTMKLPPPPAPSSGYQMMELEAVAIS
jgi:hypothetical protein